MKLSSIIAAFAVVAAASASEGNNDEEGSATSAAATSTSKTPSILDDLLSDNPLGYATKTESVDSFGFFSKPTWIPSNFPNFPTKPVNTDASTSNDAKNNPFQQNSPQHRGNWQFGYDINTDTTSRCPETGRTVKYSFNVVNTTASPEGVTKPMLLINNQFPGPLVEANWGDWIEVTVKNSLQNNGTGIHWHGFRQLGTNDNDGVGGITECPIAPGHSKVYRFRATSFGTTWYHSHFSAQYGDGVVGPVIIHGPASANYDIDVGQVQITDTYPRTIFQEDYLAHRQGGVGASNYYVNGHNTSPDGTTGTRTTFTFTKGKKHLLRLINSSTDNMFKIQLDGHNFTVIANDFVPIVPYVTKEIALGIGQRYDVIVEANQPVANYYLRALAASACSQNANSGTGTANPVVRYSGAPSGLPVTSATPINPNCFDELASNLVPIVPASVPSSGFASAFQDLNVTVGRAQLVTGDFVFLWYINGVSESIDWANPTLAQAVTGNDTFSAEKHVIVLPQDNTWTYWVLQNQFFVPHPMHLHGHDFAMLGQGNGTFDPNVHLSLLNFKNPTRRDVAMLIPNGWTVIAFKTDNPGSWLMHCHIAWHVGEGLSLQFLEQPDNIPSQYGNNVRSSAFQNNCAAWKTYQNGPVAYNKSDSGLRRRTPTPVDEALLMDVRKHMNEHKRRAVF